MSSNSQQQNQPMDPRKRPGSKTQVPRQPAPVHHVSYASSWLHFLLFLCLIVAWWFPARMIVSRLIFPRTEKGPRTSECFIALAYEGVSDKTNEVSGAQFRKHIAALKEHGYVPITLDDVRGLVFEGRRVPEKSILLTFDHSRRTSFYEANKVLRKAGWNAVMFLWTQPIVERDSSALLWTYAKGLARSRWWEVGAQSHGGYLKVPKNVTGERAHFMTSRKWLASEGRMETVDEFHERIQADHEKCLDLIEKKIGVRPIAYAYPYGDFGQYEREAKVIRRINMGLVDKYYDLGFLSGRFGVNTAQSDPKRLSRMRVSPEWSAEDLISNLETMWPKEDDVEITAEDMSPWVLDWGFMRRVQERISLEALKDDMPSPGRVAFGAMEEKTGARIWLAGSDRREDFHARLIVRLVEGQLGVFVRATPDEERSVYLGIDTKGNVWLRQKHVGMDSFTLASAKVPIDTTRDHVLDVYVREKLFGASLDGQNLFDERIQLRGTPRPGMLGVSVWHPEQGMAKAEVVEVLLQDQRPTLASWEFNDEQVPYFIQWIHQNGFRLTQLSPSWLSVRAGGYLQMMDSGMSPFETLADIYSLSLTPRVQVEDSRWLSLLLGPKLSEQMSDISADGVYLDLQRLEGISEAGLKTWLVGIGRELAAKGFSLLVQFPPNMEKADMLHSMMATVPGLQVVVASASPMAEGIPGSNNPPVLAEEIPEQEEGQSTPFHFEIDMAQPPGEFAKQEIIQRLRDEGRTYFQAGEYAKAIESWTAWQDTDTTDPLPLMLIGDAYVRMAEADKALKYYAASLDRDPGRVSLAMKQAYLLESAGRDEEAVEIMNRYGLLFPENPEVIIAQAEWLARHGRLAEAQTLIAKALEESPDDLELIIAALRFSSSREKRTYYMDRLLEVGSRPQEYAHLAEAIEQYDLLSLPEGHMLMTLADRISKDENVDEDTRALFDRFKMRTSPVIETFDEGHLSDAWHVSGGVILSRRLGEVRIQADATHREAMLRLSGSERVRDGWIEADVRKGGGEVWLIGRRGPDNYVRFGIDQTYQLFIQAWRNGRRVANVKRPWGRLTKSTNLRLEVRGNGAIGYVDGEPAFGAPLTMPSNLGLGSWGLAVFAPESGQGSVIVDYLSAGPLPIHIAVLPPLPKEEAELDDLLLRLKSEERRLSAVSPQWYSMHTDGTLMKEYSDGDELLKILARYYGIRIMPVIKMPTGVDLPVEEITAIADELRLDGFILLFGIMPDDEWFVQAEQALGPSSLEILAVVPDDKAKDAQVRGIGAGVGFIPSTEPVETTVALRHWIDEETGEHRPLETLPPTQHSIILP